MFWHTYSHTLLYENKYELDIESYMMRMMSIVKNWSGRFVKIAYCLCRLSHQFPEDTGIGNPKFHPSNMFLHFGRDSVHMLYWCEVQPDVLTQLLQ